MKEFLDHVAQVLSAELVGDVCRHCGHVSTCDAHASGCPRGELLKLMRFDKILGRWVPRLDAEKALLEEFAGWLLREHTVVTSWAGEIPNETYERAEQMIEDFTRGRKR